MKDVVIDRNTGHVKIISRNWEFGPDFTLGKFHDSESFKLAKKVSETSTQYQVHMQHPDAWHSYFILSFRGENLAKALLGFSKRELRWADWSLENERERKKIHDSYLLTQLGSPPYISPWGRVVSVIDPRNQEAYIKIEYNTPA